MAAKLNLLTTAQCNAAKTEGRSIRKYHDGGGLYLWVYEDGSKFWRLRYWIAGKEKSLSFGAYPEVSLKEARARRDEERKKIDGNVDPSVERKLTKIKQHMAANNSFKSVAMEWYEKQTIAWVKKHAEDVKRRLESNIFPELGNRPISEIEAPELLAAIQKIESRGAYDLSHRVNSLCGQIFRYGIATGRCSRDIARDLRGALTPHIKKHQLAVRPEQLPQLLYAIDRYDEIGDLQTQLALKLLALTFVRTTELIAAEWSEFDLEKRMWVIPAERMKMSNEHLVPLADQALEILQALKSISSSSRFLFPGRNIMKPISNNTLLFALYRLGYKGKMTGHGFRSVASTALNEMGFRPDVIERQLAHCEKNKVRGAYNRAEYIRERISMMQHWANYLDGIRSGAKIVAFRTPA
jgi:integrase